MVRVNTYVTIAGTDVSTRIFGWKFIDTFGNEIPDAHIVTSKNVISDLTISQGDEVIIKRGATTGQEENVFKGNVDTIVKSGPTYIIKCKDKLIQLVRRDVNTSFDKDIDTEAGVGSEIANTLITSASFGGLSTNSGATVQSTGTTILLEKFVCRKTDIFERVKTIADIYDYQIYYNYDDDYVYFEPTGYQTNANALTVGSNVSNLPDWEYDNTQLINQIRVEGAEALVQTIETQQLAAAGVGDYNVTDFLLANSPFSVEVFVDTASDPAETIAKLQTGGVPDSTETYDYSVDEQNKKIVWNTIPTATHYAKVKYSYPAPIPVVRKKTTSIDTYGLSATTKHFLDIRTIEDAANRGNLYLQTYAEPFIRTKLHVPSISNSYKVGEKVTVIDAVNDENRELTINKIVKTFPHKHDIIHVGNKEYAIAEYNRLTLDRIKRLEEELSKNDDILIQLVDLDRTIKPRRRYFKLQKEIIADPLSLVWDHVTQGQWNDGGANLEEWGGNAFGSTSVVKILQGNMVYEEYAYDDDFKDSTASATAIREYYNTGDNTGLATHIYGASYWNAQTFTIGTVSTDQTQSLTTIKLKLYRSGSPGTLTLSVQELDGGGDPDGSDLSTGTYNGNLLTTSTSGDWYEFTMSAYNLQAGTQYALVIKAASGDASNYAVWRYDSIGASYSGGQTMWSTDGGTSWGFSGISDCMFEIYGTIDTTFTATLNTTNKDITFADGQIALFGPIDIGTTLSWITVTLGTTVGTLVIEISSDNKSSWQTVTNGTRTAVTTSDGTGTYIRITSTGVSTIDLTQDSYGRNTAPVIKAKMEE
jgi:hypothetical protein